MCRLYLCSTVGGAHGGEYHGGGTVTKLKLANHSRFHRHRGEKKGHEETKREEMDYTPASPKKGAYMGFSSEVMFGGS